MPTSIREYGDEAAAQLAAKNNERWPRVRLSEALTEELPHHAVGGRKLVCALGGALSGFAALPGPLAPVGALVGSIAGHIAAVPFEIRGVPK